ncbi:MAG: YaiI/YqxD family protein [Bacillota bacterium]|nr:YaiI/YqxD family protein [Bacillota bacterium]
MANKIKLLVDADGCPVPVKQIIINMAKEYKLEVVMIKNICHELQDDYAKIITVDQGRDAADLVLINNTKAGDIVITQDYGVAALALAKKAIAINQNGWLYTNENIDELLAKRHVNQEMRRKHNKYTKIPKRKNTDNHKFQQLLQELMTQVLN